MRHWPSRRTTFTSIWTGDWAASNQPPGVSLPSDVPRIRTVRMSASGSTDVG